MARYSVLIKPSAVGEIEAIPQKRLRQRMVARIESLAGVPRPRGCEKLSNRDQYRVRQGVYRIAYTVEDVRVGGLGAQDRPSKQRLSMADRFPRCPASAMMPEGYTWRPLGMDDVRAVYELEALGEAFADGEVEIALADVEADWRMPDFDPADDDPGCVPGRCPCRLRPGVQGSSRGDGASRPSGAGHRLRASRLHLGGRPGRGRRARRPDHQRARARRRGSLPRARL